MTYTYTESIDNTVLIFPPIGVQEIVGLRVINMWMAYETSSNTCKELV